MHFLVLVKAYLFEVEMEITENFKREYYIFEFLNRFSLTRQIFDLIWMNWLHNYVCNKCDPNVKKSNIKEKFYEECKYLESIF